MTELKEKATGSEVSKATPFRIDKTLAAINKTKSDIAQFCRIYGIIVQIIFIAYYIYAVITNLKGGYLLVINSVMLGLVLVRFFFDILTYRKKKEAKIKGLRKSISRALRYTGHTIHIVSVVFAIYSLLVFDSSEIKIATTMAAIGSIVFQIIIEAVRLFVDKYFTLIYTGIQMDIEEFKDSTVYKAFTKTVDTASNFPATVIELVDRPLEKLANKKLKKDSENNSEMSCPDAETDTPVQQNKKETERRRLLSSLSDKDKERRAERRQQEKEEKEKAKEERLSASLKSLKSHIKSIFGKDR